jgi:hypothetical protein
MKTITILLGVIFCIFFFPIFFGVIGAIFGVMTGIVGGIFGIIAGVFGGILGGIAGMFEWIFGGDHHFGFFHWNGFTLAAIVVLIIIVAKSKRNPS